MVLQNNSVEIANMADNSVGTNELVNDSVTDDKMADNAIATSSLKDNAVTIAKMADNSVGTSEIVNNAVTRAKVTPGGFNPVGTVIWYAGSTAPAGYLKCNGDSIANGSGTTQSITADFSELYAIVGSTLPDLRGEFVRGWDDGKGTDSGRSIRSAQGDQNKQHNHTANVTDPGHTHVYIGSATTQGVDTDSHNHDDAVLEDTENKTSNSNTTGISVSIVNDGGNETRPRNIALLACIKY